MFEILVFVLIQAFWFTLIIGTLTLFSLRLSQVILTKQSFKNSLIILFTPCSIGYYYFFKEESKFKKIYRTLVIIFFVTAVLSSLFLIYINLGGGML